MITVEYVDSDTWTELPDPGGLYQWTPPGRYIYATDATETPRVLAQIKLQQAMHPDGSTALRELTDVVRGALQIFYGNDR